ncbi:MAG TPA: 50S ribosomal protein L24 [Saprospiraceae bacterium]|nr:50S ribosomal protein L24 [Saprospiraceae bacterium]MCB9269735.1 50S ribosomal protein L24 [Lewinellaceae bacterium]HPG06617.1 50S ribosomal protein L24 [Saprospiraceae bacterium]HQU54825.1 50S ribosomal protein L24 [Saprospiraceae bacterium]HRV83666.1 50S ribosomal protein L24 [Saprospiraceae bacterium]
MPKKINSHITQKLHIRKGDTVLVNSGAYKGTKGEVLQVFPKKYTAIVDGVNPAKKHMKPTNDNPGGIHEINRPIHLSNLSVLDPKSGEPTRVGRKMVGDKLVRYSKKSGEIIK